VQKKPRRSRRRLVILVLLGLVIGGGITAFFRHVYSPFGASVVSPIVLVPDDMDFVLWVPDFPLFAGGLPDQEFCRALERHRGFQEFLDTPWSMRTGVADTLRAAFREMNKLSASLPFGLTLLGDVSGQGVVVAGYLPAEEPGRRADAPRVSPDELRFMAVLQPRSWMAVAAANVLLSPRLTDWFLRDQLRRHGIEVEHYRDSVRLRPKGGRDLFLTRVADAVLLSTEGDQLGRIAKEVALEGLPTVVAPRYSGLVGASSGEFPSARLVAGRRALDRLVDLEGTLRELWGPATLSLAESCLPRVGGEDLLLGLEIGPGLGVSLRADRGLDREHDLVPLLQGFTRDEALRFLESATAFLPDDVFAFATLRCPPGRLLDWVFSRADLVPPGIASEIDGWLGRHPTLGGRPEQVARLDALLEAEVGCAFFRQPRESYPDKAEPGVAVVIPVRDPQGLHRLLEGIVDEIRRQRGEKGPKDLVRRVDGDVVFYDLLVGDGIFDDYRVTRPGLALAQGHLVLTNFQPFSDRIPSVLRRPELGAARHPGLLRAMQFAPAKLLLASVADGEALEPYLDQSAPGWATSRTIILQTDYMRQRAIFAAEEAPRRGLRPGTPEYAEAEERFVIERTEAQQSSRREDVLRTIQSHVDAFRGLVGDLGFYVEDGRRGAAFGIRLDLRRAGPGRD
jgi:hypothetical protein